MSVALLSARLFRFLAIVASASFMVFTLGMGTPSADPANATLACPSTLHLYQCVARRQLAQSINETCCSCFDPTYNRCVTDEDCASYALGPMGDPHDMRECYTRCYNQAQHTCNCACNH